MNQTATKVPRSGKGNAPAHPSGITPTDADATARMTSEGDVQSPDEQESKDSSSDTERAKRSKKADAGATDAQEG